MKCENVIEFARAGKTVEVICKYEAQTDSLFCRRCNKALSKTISAGLARMAKLLKS